MEDLLRGGVGPSVGLARPGLHSVGLFRSHSRAFSAADEQPRSQDEESDDSESTSAGSNISASRRIATAKQVLAEATRGFTPAITAKSARVRCVRGLEGR
jgi:hypothetical protein